MRKNIAIFLMGAIVGMWLAVGLIYLATRDMQDQQPKQILAIPG